MVRLAKLVFGAPGFLTLSAYPYVSSAFPCTPHHLTPIGDTLSLLSSFNTAYSLSFFLLISALRSGSKISHLQISMDLNQLPYLHRETFIKFYLQLWNERLCSLFKGIVCISKLVGKVDLLLHEP